MLHTDLSNRDAQLRQAAFDHTNRLSNLRGGILASGDLGAGFEFQGQRIPLINPQRGIFKPRQTTALLSIRTYFRVKADAFGTTISVRPTARSTRVMMSSTTPSWAPTRPRQITARSGMRCSSRSRSSNLLGTSPGRYQPIIPTFIVGWHPERLRVQLAFGALIGASAQAAPPDLPERWYALREVKARLHQASFRDAVLAAYGGRCAISHLPEERLLDAAHIIMEADEELGRPIVSNGLPLTKLHHAAFDAQLIGMARRSASWQHVVCRHNSRS